MNSWTVWKTQVSSRNPSSNLFLLLGSMWIYWRVISKCLSPWYFFSRTGATSRSLSPWCCGWRHLNIHAPCAPCMSLPMPPAAKRTLEAANFQQPVGWGGWLDGWGYTKGTSETLGNLHPCAISTCRFHAGASIVTNGAKAREAEPWKLSPKKI